MCGRSALSLSKEQIQCACSYKPKCSDIFVKPEWVNEHNNGKAYEPSCNIAPTDITPVLVSATRFRNVENTNTERILKPMMWGIIPSWHMGDYHTHKLSTNNCRLENLKLSKLYSPILRNGGRCVIVVEGYYEWQTNDKSSKLKQPYYVYISDSNSEVNDPETANNSYTNKEGWKGVKLLYIAGLYQMWQNGNDTMYAYSTITLEASSSMSWLHHRMPAVLSSQEQIQAWLDVDTVSSEMALELLRPTTILKWHKVATLVNNSKNKSAQCNKKLEEKKEEPQNILTKWLTKAEKRKFLDETEPNTKKFRNNDTGF